MQEFLDCTILLFCSKIKLLEKDRGIPLMSYTKCYNIMDQITKYKVQSSTLYQLLIKKCLTYSYEWDNLVHYKSTSFVLPNSVFRPQSYF